MAIIVYVAGYHDIFWWDLFNLKIPYFQLDKMM